MKEAREKKRTEKLSASQFTCTQVIDSGINYCKEVVKPIRYFESRSACMFAFMIKQGIPPNEIFSSCMTIPILASFIPDEKKARSVMENHFDNFFTKWPLTS